MPPGVWLGSLRISNLAETWAEVLALALSPLMHIYVAAYMIAVVWAVRRRLNKIAAAAHSRSEAVQAEPERLRGVFPSFLRLS